jgi:HK97 family phage prohead protease
MIVGYAAVFNSDSSDMGFIEQVDPGAFTKTVQEADVRGLANHDCNWLLGRSKAGTCRVITDSTGLFYEIDVNTSDPDGQRALAKVQRGDWDGSSFSFTTVRDEWNWEASPPQRRLLEVALIDVGPVTYPAYPDATATSRALQPVADKLGKPVGELVSALGTGEIRSIVNGGNMDTETTTPEADEVVAPAETETEDRSGKMLSAKNLSILEGISSQIRDLIDTAKSLGTVEGEVTDGYDLVDDGEPDENNTRSVSLLDAEMEMRRRSIEYDVAA